MAVLAFLFILQQQSIELYSLHKLISNFLANKSALCLMFLLIKTSFLGHTSPKNQIEVKQHRTTAKNLEENSSN